jgi:hypothetical protein
VSHDADIAHFVQCYGTRHLFISQRGYKAFLPVVSLPPIVCESQALPTVMRKSFVGFRHTVNVVFLFNRAATHVGSVI